MLKDLLSRRLPSSIQESIQSAPQVFADGNLEETMTGKIIHYYLWSSESWKRGWMRDWKRSWKRD